MTLKELELFYHLAKNPHISDLAKKIGMSQSAISLAIKSLEQKLSEPLFDRIGKKLVLNERGRLFREQTYRHFLALKDAQEMFYKNKLSGNLKIASSRTIGAFLMPQIIFDFLAQYPEISIEKKIENSQGVVKKVLDGEVDIGFIESVIQMPNLIQEKIGQDTLIVVSADKNLAKKTFYIDQLFSKKWILREEGSGTREIFLNKLGSLAKSLNIYMEFMEFVEVKELLRKNSDAITCISRFSVKQELQRGELFEVKIKNLTFERDLFMVYHKNKYQTRLFEEFKSFIYRFFKS